MESANPEAAGLGSAGAGHELGQLFGDGSLE
jgi:hypothetical protein